MTLDEALYGATCEYIDGPNLRNYYPYIFKIDNISGSRLSENIDNLERYTRQQGYYKISNINLMKFNIWLKEQYDDSPFPV